MSRDKASRLKKFAAQERDRRWYQMYQEGMSQKSIAEESGQQASYVSIRIKKHKERIAAGGRSDMHDGYMLAMVNSDAEKLKDDLAALSNDLERYENFEEIAVRFSQIVSYYPRAVTRTMDHHGWSVIFKALGEHAGKFNDRGGRRSEV